MKANELTHQYRVQQWTEIIKNCRSSGLTIDCWCEQNGVSRNTYYYWLRRIRTSYAASLEATDKQVQFMPIKLQKELIKETTLEVDEAPVKVIYSGLIIEIHNNATSHLLEQLMKVLKNAG